MKLKMSNLRTFLSFDRISTSCFANKDSEDAQDQEGVLRPWGKFHVDS